MEGTWQDISYYSPDQLKRARVELHRFVQLVAAAGRSFYPADPGDVHGALRFQDGSFLGKPLPNGHHFGMEISSFKLTDSLSEHLELRGKSPGEAVEWIREQLDAMQLNPEHYSLDLPYDIPDYGPMDQPAYPAGSKLFTEFGKHYSNAAGILEKVTSSLNNSSPVTVWPHHFDIATLVTLEEGYDNEDPISIGIGLSPGDDNYELPYYYLSPWPYPDPSEVSDLSLDNGRWHTRNWTGAILSMTDLINSEDQEQITRSFVQQAYSHIVEIIL